MAVTQQLNRAVACLAISETQAPPDADDGMLIGSLSEFRSFMMHNELELALDTLETIAERQPQTKEFWEAMASAAGLMGLSRPYKVD